MVASVPPSMSVVAPPQAAAIVEITTREEMKRMKGPRNERYHCLGNEAPTSGIQSDNW